MPPPFFRNNLLSPELESQTLKISTKICKKIQITKSLKQHVQVSKPNFRLQVGRVAQSVLRLVTGWTVRGSNPDGSGIFRTCPDRPWGPPNFMYNVYRFFPGGIKRAGRDADPSPLPVQRFKNRVGLYFYSP
jgi:hypothetical protein